MKRTEEVLALVAKLEAARGEDLKVLALYHLPELLEIARASVAPAPHRDAEERDDARRLELLREAMNQDVVDADAFPDETDQSCWHVYVRAPKVSGYPIFVGVFDASKHVDVSLRKWVTDTWPGIRVPTFRL